MTTATQSKAAETKAANGQPKDDAPKTANEVLAKVNEDHDWKPDPEDINTTGGIQKALIRNRDAIQALADYIDGKK